MPRLSVIVPFWNVETFIDACLESLRRQRLTDLEVILVDDGSPDGSLAIAERYVDRDSRFRLERQQNAGLGPARDAGVRHASGEYLTFVDSDDVVALDAYARAVDALAASGSDFATFRAARFDNLGVRPSIAHDLALTAPATGTHLRERPELVLDRLAWSKVYRRSFWDAHDFAFPAQFFEDYPVSIAAHLAAEKVDVLTEVGYFWRQRDGGEASITQRSNELGHVSDRFTSAEAVLDQVEPLGGEALRLLRAHLLQIDANAIIGALVSRPDAERAPYLDLARRLVARLGEETVADAAPFHRLQAELVLAGDLPALEELHEHVRRHGSDARLRRAGTLRRRWVVDLPGGDRLGDAAPPAIEVGLDDAAWVDGVLEATVSVDSPGDLGRIQADLWLEGDDGTRTPLTARVDDHRARVRLDPESLRVDGRIPRGFRVLTARVRAAGVDVTSPVIGPCHGRGRYPAPRELPGPAGLALQPYRRGEDGFGITVHRPAAQVTGCRAEGGYLVVEGVLRLPDEAARPAVGDLVVAGRRFPVTRTEDRFEARVDVAELTGPEDYEDPIAVQRNLSARLELDGDPKLLVLTPGATAAVAARGARMVSATRNVSGFLEFVEERVGPVVTEISWVGDGRLAFEGVLPGTPGEVVLRQYPIAGEVIEHRLPVTSDGATYSFAVDAAGLAPHHTAPWHLLLAVGDRLLTQTFDRTRAADFAEARQAGDRRVELLLTRNDVVRLGVRPCPF